ncbi:MAG: CGNR zinc finger domain-containing protein [Candidatus Dormibacteraeota bacterium]|nr:CGNR zinc finger domain-containing protein [Candidatus Dormibacteraeota bacterium]MBV9524756.1 CGNR zinc finger domain-containing protein [Candidatus Dormibacteraeota bacterium]
MTDTDPEPKTAPGPLELVQRFVNSLDYPHGPDELATPESAARWIEAATGDAVEVSPRDIKRLVTARETLRDLLEAHAGEAVDPEVPVRLQKLLSCAPLRPVLTTDGATLVVDCGGVDSLLGRISTAIVWATLEGKWSRLKVCRSDRCRFAYYDHSKNGSGQWCSMRVCGTREKARAYRARRRATELPAG